MNVRQKLSLAALCFTLPAMASAQAAPAAAEPAAAAPVAAPAPAPAPAAPAFTIAPYGFLALTYSQQSGEAQYPEYLGKVAANEDLTANHLSARQSRIGFTMKNADGGFLGTKSLSGRLEFDFMGGAATTTTSTCVNSVVGETCTVTSKSASTPASYDSVLPRLRYAVAMAEWAAGPGKLTAQVGQTDGLVNALHPELGAYLALPTFMLAGNLTRRSPQIRLGYSFDAGMVGVSAEAAVLSSVDGGGVTTSAGSANGTPDIEARVQATVKPMADVKAIVAVGYHVNKRLYDATKATEQEVDSSLVGVELTVDATKYLTVKGEWFKGTNSDDSQTGAWGGPTGAAPNLVDLETSGYWAQATIKPISQLWIIGGYGSTTLDAATDQTRSMMNVGILSPVSKNWRLGLEYTTASYDNGTTEVSASEIALSSRFTF